MKLSDAIRLGAMLKPQGFGARQRASRSCALHAATDALGISLISDFILNYGELQQRYPWLRRPVACPECAWGQDPLGVDVIWHLNDKHRWTRERIADWVALSEPQEPRVQTSHVPACEAVP